MPPPPPPGPGRGMRRPPPPPPPPGRGGYGKFLVIEQKCLIIFNAKVYYCMF